MDVGFFVGLFIGMLIGGFLGILIMALFIMRNRYRLFLMDGGRLEYEVP